MYDPTKLFNGQLNAIEVFYNLSNNTNYIYTAGETNFAYDIYNPGGPESITQTNSGGTDALIAHIKFNTTGPDNLFKNNFLPNTIDQTSFASNIYWVKTLNDLDNGSGKITEKPTGNDRCNDLVLINGQSLRVLAADGITDQISIACAGDTTSSGLDSKKSGLGVGEPSGFVWEINANSSLGVQTNWSTQIAKGNSAFVGVDYFASFANNFVFSRESSCQSIDFASGKTAYYVCGGYKRDSSSDHSVYVYNLDNGNKNMSLAGIKFGGSTAGEIMFVKSIGQTPDQTDLNFNSNVEGNNYERTYSACNDLQIKNYNQPGTTFEGRSILSCAGMEAMLYRDFNGFGREFDGAIFNLFLNPWHIRD